MIPVRGLSRVSRIISLSFKVTGLAEQSAAIQGMVSNIQNLIHLILMANIAYRGLMMAMAGNPLGWLMVGVTALSGVAMAQGFLGSGSTEFEEYRSRSPV